MTGDVIKIQVKGGVSWRRGNGYAVPVEQHASTWSDGNVPVFCVVYDPETGGLYWANATRQLRRSLGKGENLPFIGITANARLDSESVGEFAAEARKYAGRYRGVQAIRNRLGEMAGVEFDSNDIVQHFVNDVGESLVFWQRVGDPGATLLHSDLGWEEEYITPEMLDFGVLGGGSFGGESSTSESSARLIGSPVVGDVILSFAEALWLVSCFSSTRWAREYGGDDVLESESEEHGCVDADLADEYIIEQVLDRLEVEPGLLDASIEEMRRSSNIVPDMLDGLGELESDPKIVREARSIDRETIHEVSFEAVRLLILYLIDRVLIGGPSLPLDQQIRIVWRIPEGGAR